MRSEQKLGKDEPPPRDIKRSLTQSTCFVSGSFCLCHSFGPLSSCVVDIGVAGEQDLGYGDDGVAVLLQRLDDPGQGLRRMFGGVVEEDDAAGTDVFQHPLLDLLCRDALPVQTVAFPYN